MLCWRAAADRKADAVTALDLRELSSVADFFLLCCGTSEPHLRAIREEVEKQLRDRGIRPRAVDGFPESRWIVMDYRDVMVHIFDPPTREYYALEELWADAGRWAPPADPDAPSDLNPEGTSPADVDR